MNDMTAQARTISGSTGTAGSPAGAGAAPGEGTLEIGDLLRILSERRYIVLGGAALGVIAAIIVSLLMTPLYRASALMELNSPNSEVIDEASGRNKGGSVAGTQELMATQLGLLTSDSLARRVTQDLNLALRPEFGGAQAGARSDRIDIAVDAVQRNTMVEAVKGSMLIKVSFNSPDPALAAQVANALAGGFIAGSLERRYDSSSYARDFLSNQLATTKQALEDSERELNGYAIQAGIFRTPGQVSNGVTTEGASLAATNLQALNDALNNARVARISAENNFRNAGLAVAGSAQSSTVGLRVRRAELQSEYDQKARVFKEDYPEMRQLSTQIAALDRSIRNETAGVSGGKRAELQAAYQSARSAEAELAAQVASYKGEVEQERGRSIQYNILQREVDTNRSLYDALLQRYKEIGVAGGIGRSNVSMVDEAEVPRAPYRPNLPLNTVIGLLGGLSLGVMFSVIAHLLLDNIVTPSDVRGKLGMPVLGVIPADKDDRSLFEALEDRKSDVSEAYYAVRTALRFSDPDGAPKSLLLTSTRPGEGKSTSAYAIASSFARTGVKVLLIDADLRKPTFVSRRSDNRGLGWLLTEDAGIGDYVEPTRTENLDLLPVGRFTGSAAELLASARLGKIAQEARAQYDMVVYDGPPVLGLADAPLLGALADKTIVVVESRSARTSGVSEMVRRLRDSGANILGVILTKVRSDISGYNYYSYKYGDGGEGGHVSSDPARAFDVSVSKPST